MQKDGGWFRFTGIRRKVFINSLIPIFFLGLTSAFSYYLVHLMMEGYQEIFVDYQSLNALNQEVSKLNAEAENYLNSRSSEALLRYYTSYNNLQGKIDSFPDKLSYETDQLMLKDIGHMIQELLEETENAITAKRGRITGEYMAHFKRAAEISLHIKTYIHSLLNYKLETGSLKYQTFTAHVTWFSWLNLLLIMLALLLNITLAVWFTYTLTKPILQLSEAAKRISQGELDVGPVTVKRNDEIEHLAQGFNNMVVHIRNYIQEIKRKAEVESLLREQEMQNMTMKNLLKEAELKSLQSQINPHFLFNTLNAAAQLAMMEGADRSSELIQRAADLYRYQLKKMEVTVTLADEIENARNYMYILQTRFGDKIRFALDVDERVTSLGLPGMVIQPILENAIIHGLEGMEGNGEVNLRVYPIVDKVRIEITDNGKGMGEEEIKGILADEKGGRNSHLAGIGLRNVNDRLRLFFGLPASEGVLGISSKVGKGTKVTVTIPWKEGVSLAEMSTMRSGATVT